MTAEVATMPERSHAMSRAIRRDSLWLFSGYATTAGIGFIFWIVAAARVSPSALGTDAALVSVFSAASVFTCSGIGSAMVVMLPVAGRHRGALIRHAFLITLVLAAIAGVVAGIASAVALEFPVDQWLLLVGAMALMVVIWAMFNLQDQVLTGLDQARWTLFLDGPANLGKLLLTIVATTAPLAITHPVVAATILPAGISVTIAFGILVPRMVRIQTAAPETHTQPELFARFGRFALRDTGAIGLMLGVGLLSPFLVTALAGAVQGALYALAYQISVALDLVTSGVATAMAKNSSSDQELGIGLSGRLGLRVAGLVAIGAVLVTAATPVAFAFLGRNYDPVQATIVVGLLAAGCLARSPFSIWSSLMRAQQRINPVLAANAVAATVLVGLLLLLIPLAGAVGAAGAVLGGAVCMSGIGVFGLRRLRRQPASEGEES